jgi:hypothetical protein
MDYKIAKFLIAICIDIGVITLLTGMFSDLYDFSTGLWISILIWALTGVLAIVLGVKLNRKHNSRRKR